MDYMPLSRKRPVMVAEIDYTFGKFPVIKNYLLYIAGLIGLFTFKFLIGRDKKFFNRQKIKKL